MKSSESDSRVGATSRTSPVNTICSGRSKSVSWISLSRRSRARSANTGLSSMPRPLRSSRQAALSVEPIPTKGSRTVFPFLLKKRMSLATSVKENGAGWRSFGHDGH